MKDLMMHLKVLEHKNNPNLKQMEKKEITMIKTEIN